MFSLFKKGLSFHQALTNQIAILVFDNSGCFLCCVYVNGPHSSHKGVCFLACGTVWDKYCKHMQINATL